MQQLGSVQGYLSDHSGSSQYHAAHASRERNEFSRAGQEYFVHPMERPQFDGRSHFDGRLGAESRGRPAAGLEFSSRGSEHSLSQALSSRSPARNFPMNSIMSCQYCRYPRMTMFCQAQKTVSAAASLLLVAACARRYFVRILLIFNSCIQCCFRCRSLGTTKSSCKCVLIQCSYPVNLTDLFFAGQHIVRNR
jgi:hypothetical protein